MNKKPGKTWKENWNFMLKKSDDNNGFCRSIRSGITFLLIPLFHLLSCNTDQAPTTTSDSKNMKYIRAYQAYINTCASCHNPIKSATGPALSDVLINSRSEEWLYTFLTNSVAIKNDDGLIKRQQEYAPIHCIILDTTTTAQQEEIRMIITYLKKYRNQQGIL